MIVNKVDFLKHGLGSINASRFGGHIGGVVGVVCGDAIANQ